MKIKINEKVNNFSEEEKKLIYEVYYRMSDYFDDDEKEKEVLSKLFECIEIK
jgi:hypothetical protein